MGSIFSKRVQKIGIPKIQEIRKITRLAGFGTRTNIFGFWDHSNGQKSAPNKIKHVPGPKKPLKDIFIYFGNVLYNIIYIMSPMLR